MSNRVGAIISIAGCLAFLAVLAWPYTVKSPSAITTYYRWGISTPLLAGVLVLGVLVVFVATRGNLVSAQLGAGVVLALGLFVFLITLVWAVTVRVDVFRAPGWALPAQRFVLVGLAALIVVGAGWHTWANGLFSPRR